MRLSCGHTTIQLRVCICYSSLCSRLIDSSNRSCIVRVSTVLLLRNSLKDNLQNFDSEVWSDHVVVIVL